MSFRADDDEVLKIRPHRRRVRGDARSGGRRGAGLSGSLLNKWNFAEGSRAAVFKKIASGGTHSRSHLLSLTSGQPSRISSPASAAKIADTAASESQPNNRK